jgi:hypothetical protein
MSAKSVKQYGLMQAAAHGSITGKSGPTKSVAKEFIDKTPSKKRKKFAKALAMNRKEN